MNWHWVLIVSASVALAADAAAQDKKEPDKLKGSWTVMSYERDTKQLPADKAKEIKYDLADDKLTLKAGIGFTGGKEHAVKLDATKKPKQIDITPADGRNKGKTFQGIYEIDGDKLKICVSAPDKDRPKEFATKDGSYSILMNLQRDNP